jgi:Phosphatidylinositol 3- and 4-kinase
MELMRWPVEEDVARALLRDGDVEVLGRLPWSSNATFLVKLHDDGREMFGVYKPQRGERPLWDFPRGTLCHREVAAYEVSDALGWRIVPDTVLRDGPAGIGMVQRFVEHDPEDHYFTLLEEHGDDFRRMAAFDVVINNTDRKGGHCLRDSEGRIFGIDHGVAFHALWKVRTVIWDFGGERLPARVRDDLECFADKFRSGALDARFRPLLDRFELDALQARVQHLLQSGVLPEADESYHCYPWPMV